MQSFVAEELLRQGNELPEDLLDELLTAWSQQEERFSRLYLVLQPQGRTWNEDPEDVDRRLAEAGLTGPELRIKLRIFEEAADAYREKPTPTRFGTALSAADVPLGSLARVFTWMDPVKEIKEVIESLFSWGRGWLRRRLGRGRRR